MPSFGGDTVHIFCNGAPLEEYEISTEETEEADSPIVSYWVPSVTDTVCPGFLA